MEIEPKEYVRIDKGTIGKVIGIFDSHCKAKYHIEFQGNVKVKRQYLSTKTIVKHSKNIIDLIEVGDFVNGSRVDKIELGINEVVKEQYLKINDNWAIYNWNVKTILTKEQYNQNCYRLEE